MVVSKKAMNPKSITIQLDDKQVVIQKLPLRKIAEVFKALEKLPSKFADIDFKNIDNNELMGMLPGMIGDVLPEVAKLISIATPLTEEQVLDELGLAEVIEVLTAMFEVNDFSKVVDNVKKLMARKPLAESSNKKTGSTEPSTS